MTQQPPNIAARITLSVGGLVVAALISVGVVKTNDGEGCFGTGYEPTIETDVTFGRDAGEDLAPVVVEPEGPGSGEGSSDGSGS